MQPSVQSAEAEVTPGAAAVLIANLWTASVGPRFFETFDIPLLAGRDFHDGDRAAEGRAVLVNEAFAGIFSLMSVSVARRTKEIGLRTALGASRGRLIAGVFTRALTLVGSGIAAGNSVLVLFVSLSDEVDLADVTGALLMTSRA